MQIFKTKLFHRWLMKQRLDDSALLFAAYEIQKGLVDASPGGAVYKKRIATGQGGKRGGARAVVIFKSGERLFYVYGFNKNRRSNINKTELKALKLLATQLLGLDRTGLIKATRVGELIEVTTNEQIDT